MAQHRGDYVEEQPIQGGDRPTLEERSSSIRSFRKTCARATGVRGFISGKQMADEVGPNTSRPASAIAKASNSASRAAVVPPKRIIKNDALEAAIHRVSSGGDLAVMTDSSRSRSHASSEGYRPPKRNLSENSFTGFGGAARSSEGHLSVKDDFVEDDFGLPDDDHHDAAPHEGSFLATLGGTPSTGFLSSTGGKPVEEEKHADEQELLPQAQREQDPPQDDDGPVTMDEMEDVLKTTTNPALDTKTAAYDVLAAPEKALRRGLAADNAAEFENPKDAPDGKLETSPTFLDACYVVLATGYAKDDPLLKEICGY